MLGLLSIIWSILKIIGITLLIIIGLIIFILCLILFVPVRYNIDINYKEKPDIKVRITYLLRIVRAYYIYNPKEDGLSVKVLWFNIIGGNKKNKEKKPKKKRIEADRDDLDAPDNMSEDELEEMLSKNSSDISYTDSKDEVDTVNIENVQLESDEIKDDEVKVTESDDDKAADIKTDNAKEKKSITKKKSKDKKSKPIRKNTGNNSGTDGIIDKIKSIITLLKENKHVVKFIWKQVKKLFKHILPGSHVINLKLGLDDPGTLGEIIGVVSVVRAGTNLELNLTPDFDNKVLEVDCHFKGRIRVFTLLYIVLTVYFNKNIKKIINKLKA